MITKTEAVQECYKELIGELGFCWGTLLFFGTVLIAMMIFFAKMRNEP